MFDSTHFEELNIVDNSEVDTIGHTPPMQEVVESKIPQEDPIISLHALAGISTTQTLKLQWYIKNCKVVVLVDSRSTHIFIHKRAEETHY